MINLDNIDRQLIALLRQNARLGISALAKKLNVSRATVQNRMDKLEQHQVITAYTAVIGNDTANQLTPVRALMNIEVEGNSSQKVKASLLQEPSVTAIHSTNGRWDLVAEIETDSLITFDKVLGRIRSFKGISTSETSLLLSTIRFNAKS
jgi:DNA-binding Lrp family transcriptional regulator